MPARNLGGRMRKLIPCIRLTTAAMFTAIIFAVTAYGQFRAGIQGTVTDTNGAVVPGARVSLKSNETGRTLQTVTTDAGFYSFTMLSPGTYTITVTAGDSFKKAVVEKIQVRAETTEGVNITLEPGGISETVTVQAENEGLATEDPNIRKVISTEEVLRLPQVGRDPYELARLAPGVFGAGARNASGGSVSFPNTSGPGGSNSSIFQTENQVPITANGQRLSSNNFQIDGTSVNSQTWGGAAVITPSQESVKEVQVLTSTYSAEDGRNSGIQLKVVSQNGTNQWHGSAFFKLNDPVLNAFNTMPIQVGSVSTQGPQRVEQKYKSYGGSFGGRIIRDKLFFFFSYEGLNNKTSNTRNTFVETAQFRQAVIAARPNTVTQRLLSATGIEPRIVQVLAPTCAGIFSGCAIVGNGIDVGSITGTYGNYVPTFSTNPNGGGLDGIADLQWVQISLPTSFRGNQYFTRIDYNATAKDNFTVTSYITPVTFKGSDSSAQSRPMADITSKRLNYLVGVIYNRTISSRMVNEVRFNMTRWGIQELDANPDARFDLPRVEIEGIFSDRLRFGPPWGLNTPADILERQLDFRDVLTWVKGNHSLKFGAEYRLDINSNFEIGGARPLYSFHRMWNFANGTPIFELLTANNQGKPTANNTSFQTGDLAFFIQDNWKFRPNLTLNLGLRWEYFSPITARKGVIGNLILGPNGGLGGAVISTAKQLTDRDLNNFGPQLGFAWSPKRFNDKLVIRGGGGIGYDRLANALLANARRNPPNGAIYGICCGTAPGEFGSPFAGGQIVYANSSDGTIFGFPVHPLIGGGTNPANGLPVNGSVEIYGAPRKLPNAYVYRYSLEGQYELPWRMVASLGYQGSLGRRFVRIDRVHITVPSSNPNIFAGYFARPDVNSSFNALLASLRGRLNYGLSFNLNYRFSKSLDTVSWEAPCGCTDQSFPVDQKEEHGPSDFDVRHATTASFIWDIPFFTDKSKLTGKLLGGWQISSIITQHTGFPWTPKIFGCLQQANTPGAFCDPRPTSYNGTRPAGNSNANFLRPNGIFGVPGTSVFGTAFNSSNPFANRPAIGRNSLFGPKYFSADVSISKKFGLPQVGILNENASLDVRFNFFNVFNNLNLAPFNSNSDPTRVQLQTFGIATNGLAGRVGEFQVRFSF